MKQSKMANTGSKALAILLAFLIVFTGIGFTPDVEAAAQEPTSFTILHTNDVHGRAEEDPENGVIGYPRYKTIIDEYKANGPTLVLDGGDNTHGTNFASLTDGESMVELMNMVGVQAFTLGNHEFNYGVGGVQNLESLADFPFMASNMYEVETGNRPFDTTALIDMNGVQVGIFGLATPETKYKADPRNTEGFEFDTVGETTETANRVIGDLEDKGADVIVLLSHLGLDTPSADTGYMNTYTLLDNVDGIDIVIDAHSHTYLPNGEMYDGALIASTGSHLENVGKVEVTYDPATDTVDASASLISYDDAQAYEPNQEVQDYIDSINAEQAQLLEVVGNTATVLDGERGNVRTGETNLANLITDTLLEVSGADVVLTNGGGIRASINEGEITYGEVFEVLPFGNEITVIEVTGQDILDALTFGAQVYPGSNGGFPQVAGVEYTILAEDEDPATPNEVIDVTVNGQPLELDKTYSLATNDFMAVGGDGYTMFQGKTVLSEHGPMLDAVVDKITELSQDGPFTYTTDGRIKVVNEAPSQEAEPVEVETGYFLIETTSSMYVRPVENSPISLGILPKEANLVAYDDGGAWLRIQYEGRDAYIAKFLTTSIGPVEEYESKSSAYVRPVKNSSQSLGILADDTEILAYDDGSAWLRFAYEGQEAYVAKWIMEATEGREVYELTSSLYVRPERNSSKSLGILPAGEKIEAYDEGAWLRFEYEGQEAYVAKQWTRNLGPTQEFTATSTIYIRPARNSSEVLGILDAGTEIDAVADGPFWSVYEFDDNGTDAYVATEYLKAE